MAKQSVLLGIFFMMMAGIAVTAEMVFSMVMLRMKWPYWRITALSCILCGILVSVFLVVSGTPAPDAKRIKWVILLGLFSALYWGLGVLAAQIGAAPGDIAALTSISIVVAALMGRVFLNERFRILHAIAVTLSLGGALLISRPEFIFTSDEQHKAAGVGYICAIASGFLQGCFFICARKAGDVSAGHLALSALLFSTPLCAFIPFAPLVQEPSFMLALNFPADGLLWTTVAVLTTMSSAFFSCAGSMLCPAAISSTVYVADSMLFGYLVQSLFFGVVPEFLTVCGSCLMLAAVSLMAFASRSKQSSANSNNEVTASEAELPTEDKENVTPDDDNQSLASFAASEFSDFLDIKLDVLRFRRRDTIEPHQIGSVS